MPTFSGFSNNELQYLGDYVQGANPFVAVDFPGFELQDYKQRVGLLLVCQKLEDSSPRVIEVRKLFAGTGVLLVPQFMSPLAIIVLADWYRSGVAWSMSGQ